MNKTPIIASCILLSGMVWRWIHTRKKTVKATPSPLYIYILSLHYTSILQLDGIMEEDRSTIADMLTELIGESENKNIWSNGRMTCWTSRTKPIRAITYINRPMLRSHIQETVSMIDLIQRGFHTQSKNSAFSNKSVKNEATEKEATEKEASMKGTAEKEATVTEVIEKEATEKEASEKETSVKDTNVKEEFFQLDANEQILNRVLNEVEYEKNQQKISDTWNIISYISRNALFYY